MNASTDDRDRYQWKVVAVADEELEAALNSLEAEWEIFSVVPTIKFGSSLMMGAPMPNAVVCNVIVRRPNGRMS
jgi:hypothetical protein